MSLFLCFWLVVCGQTRIDSVAKTVAPKGAIKSPGKAVLLSFLIPGGGQIYTKNYWKAGIIAPAEIGLGYLSYQAHLQAEQALKQGDTTRYPIYRDRRTTFLWWTAVVVAFSMADAYVSAQMFGFDQELRLDIAPDRLGLILAFGPLPLPQ